jgi:hypothetical protein
MAGEIEDFIFFSGFDLTCDQGGKNQDYSE